MELTSTTGSGRRSCSPPRSALWLCWIAATTPAAAFADTEVDFIRDVQPILAAKCLRCHGPGEQEAGLRLDRRERAVAELDSGARAVVPGDPEASALIERITAAADELRMPPEGRPLTPDEVGVLTAWIRTGAGWSEHWAYRALERPVVPAVDSPVHRAWVRNPIDAFVLQKLVGRGLAPSPPASKRVLLQRVYVDLIGMLPSRAEIVEFERDDSPNAYETVVDRLLASPQYGERWARRWMDVAHYADSLGFEHDLPRNSWPYRDYLIRAFNADKPYGEFIVEQVAGDVLFPDRIDALEATGFLALGPWDKSALQAGQMDTDDFRMSQYLDRDDIVSTVMSTFVSSTVHCARCHDHKFDPITQEDYYSLQAVFAGVDKAEFAYDRDPQTAQTRRRLTAELDRVRTLREHADTRLLEPQLQEEVARWEAELQGETPAWRPIEVVGLSAAEGTTLTRQENGSVLASGERPQTDTYRIVVRSDLKRITGLKLELLADASLPHGGPGRQENGNLHLTGFSVQDLSGPGDQQDPTLKIAAQVADFNQAGYGVELAVDGVASTGWGVYPEIGKSHWGVFELATPRDLAGDGELEVRLEQSFGGGHLIGRFRLWVTDSPSPSQIGALALPEGVRALLQVPASERSAAQRAELAGLYRERRIEEKLSQLPPRDSVYRATNQFEATGAMQPAATPRPIHLLERGNITSPGPLASPGAVALIADLPSRFVLEDADDEGQRRAALAAWLADRKNALTWRSMANRTWQFHFGRGLVDTPNDFGQMGAAPTHPELLDWLAAELRDNGGSLKALHRLVVTSAAYRQASTHNAPAAAIDADNRLYWRMNRQRLDAEAFHDSLLKISGTLDPTMYGPPVKHFVDGERFNLRSEADYGKFDGDDPANYRRAVYRFMFRTFPDPFMDALDCPDGVQLTPVRNESVTAIQALAAMNDKFVISQSQHAASKLEAGEGGPSDRVAAAYELILGRPPEKAELDVSVEYAERFGLANLCRMLFNCNEFMFID